VFGEEHQRFYDKLRVKIEQYICKKGVNDQISQLILLAPLAGLSWLEKM
jgi:isocitrate lyase